MLTLLLCIRYWTAQASKEELYDFVLEKTKPLHPRFTEVIHSTKSSEIGKPPIVFRDLSLEDIPDGNITLLGDAAHPMAPCKLSLLFPLRIGRSLEC